MAKYQLERHDNKLGWIKVRDIEPGENVSETIPTLISLTNKRYRVVAKEQ